MAVKALGGLFLTGIVICVAILLMAMVSPMIEGLKTVEVNLPAAQAVAEVPYMEPASAEEVAYGMTMISALPAIQVLGDHADLAHDEAAFVRQTCKDRGVYQVWRELYNRNTFHLLCMTEDGKLVDWIIEAIGKQFFEKTAFMPKNGIVNDVFKYVAGKATRFNKGW
jgi:hypothetical protein